jgi:epoxyqueuosine reductase
LALLSLNTSSNTSFVKQIAQQLGFDYCGIAKAQPLYDDAKRLENWLSKGFHGTMSYMENHFDLRIDPTKLVPNAKSVITLLKNYYPPNTISNSEYKVSKYAYGQDYHDVIRPQLKKMLQLIQKQIGQINGRGFVDSAPVLERTWAAKTGLGWVGKNGNLINKKSGSYFFIATLIVDIDLETDAPIANDFCGTCNKCIEACPTNAILPNKEINGSQCISYYTIELKATLNNITPNKNWDDWIFGCDVCQDVCPWNKFATPHNELQFSAIDEINFFTKADWENLTEETFNIVFKNSPIKRSKFQGLKRNINWLKK